MEKRIQEGREFLKSKKFELLSKKIKSDQQQGAAQPPLEKTVRKNGILFKLPDPKEAKLKTRDFTEIVEKRKSHRVFSEEPLSLEELSYLLWATQGVKDIKGDNYATIRTVPSAGARHPFETYLWVNSVEGLEKGLYRYLALDHKLAFIKEGDFSAEISEASMGQKFVGNAAVTFVWSVIPYRGEWRYDVGSHKPILIDSGHVCQNLYLASEALGLGTCAIAAYFQRPLDDLFDLEGEDEFCVYLAPVGHPKDKSAG